MMDAPPVQYDPIVQLRHAASEVAFTESENVPDGHETCEAPPEQYSPIGQSMHVSIKVAPSAEE